MIKYGMELGTGMQLWELVCNGATVGTGMQPLCNCGNRYIQLWELVCNYGNHLEKVRNITFLADRKKSCINYKVCHTIIP